MRFLHAEHRRRFIAAHGRLRELLAAELHCQPAALQFTASAHGKPELAAPFAPLHFNLSHSGGLGFVGWSRGRRIGVDVEVWRAMRDEGALVRRFFSPAENAAYLALPHADRARGFFDCWTRKEAYVKALGRGLSLPLDSFDVSLEQGAGARLLRGAEDAGAAAWTLLDPGTRDVAASAHSVAVVLEGDACHVLRTESAASATRSV